MYGKEKCRVDDLDASQGTDSAATETSTGGETETTSSADTGATGGNPAWKPLQEKLGVSFGLIQDDLKAMDKAAQSRIESVNAQFAPFKPLADQGYTPQSIQQALQIAKEIETDPLAFNQKYQSFLQATGRLPQTAGEVIQAEGMEDDADGDDASSIETNPQFQQLQQQQEQMREWVQQQQFEQSVNIESQKLDAETAALKQAHPELTDEDVSDITRQAAALAVTTGKVPSLEEASKSFLATRNRILSQPRAGDSAPKLLPTSGGAPTASGQSKSLGKMDKNEITDLLAGMIAKGN